MPDLRQPFLLVVGQDDAFVLRRETSEAAFETALTDFTFQTRHLGLDWIGRIPAIRQWDCSLPSYPFSCDVPSHTEDEPRRVARLCAGRDFSQPSSHTIHRFVRDLLGMSTAAISQDGHQPSTQLLVLGAGQIAVRAQLLEEPLELIRVQGVRHVTSTRPGGRTPPSKTDAPSVS